MATASNPWLRLSADSSNDPKLIGIAAALNVPYVEVFGLWTHLLCLARKNDISGRFTDTPQEIANVMGMDVDLVVEILAQFEFHKRNLIEGNRISNWDKYQKSSDCSTERVARWRANLAAKNNPEKAAQINNKQQSDVVTLHRKQNPHVKAAHDLGVKIMTDRGVLDKMNLFHQMTSDLTPLIEKGIPECFIEQTITVIWQQREAQGNLPKSFRYYVPAVNQAWQNANQKLEGTTNGKQPISSGTSRSTGEDVNTRRSAILSGLGFTAPMDTRRTGSD